MRRIAKGLDRVSLWAARASEVTVVVLIGVCMGCLILQVVTRYFLGQATSWTEELALGLFTWVVLIGGSLGMRQAFHVRLTAAIDLLPGRARALLENAIGLVGVALGAALLVAGASYLDRTAGQLSAAMRYPIGYLYAAAPVAGLLILLHGIARLVNGPAEKADVGTRRDDAAGSGG